MENATNESVLRMVFDAHEPFMKFDKKRNVFQESTFEYPLVFSDLWNALMLKSNLSILPVESNIFISWNYFNNLAAKKEVDVYFSPVRIEHKDVDRNVWRIGSVITEKPTYILSGRPLEHVTELWAVYKLVPLQVLAVCLLTIIISTIVLYYSLAISSREPFSLAKGYSKRTDTFEKILKMLLFVLLFQASPQSPTRVFGRFIFLGWCFYSLIFKTLFLTSLVKKTTEQSTPKRIDSIGDILKHPTLKPVMTEVDADIFLKSSSSIQRAIGKHAKNREEIAHFATLVDEMDNVLNGKSVILTTQEQLFFLFYTDFLPSTEFYLSKEHYNFVQYSCMYTNHMGSAFENSMNYQIDRYIEHGIIEFLWRLINIKHSIEFVQDEAKLKVLGNEKLIYIYLFLFNGLVASICVFACEKCFAKMKALRK